MGLRSTKVRSRAERVASEVMYLVLAAHAPHLSDDAAQPAAPNPSSDPVRLSRASPGCLERAKRNLDGQCEERCGGSCTMASGGMNERSGDALCSGR